MQGRGEWGGVIYARGGHMMLINGEGDGAEF